MRSFKHKFYTLFALVALIAITAMLSACPFKKNKGHSTFEGFYSQAKQAKTTGGTTVYSKTKIDESLLPLIYQGIYALNITAGYENYTPLEHRDFSVALFPRDSRCINPAFTVRADGSPWDGTEWDKDDRPGKVLLCAAGLHPGLNIMVVANDRSHMANIVQYEGEHITLLNRDLERWQATMGVHAHPIFRQSPDGVVETEKAEKPFEFEATTITLAGDIESDGVSLKAGETVCILLTK
ncbi:hypothetical protein [Geitlerinema calcuttense]|uniref:Uncharacterized protein n=1 Tax=Geitlerinema calcuttense NRMC-F 0142 TaxID=2922238 RepID=A0ABT7LV41_9CYAN|nr:hypothetical protein [Geitlerinema calcuttense]MDL5055914.1 hypothetical protein [Geitlerinema calcuttense NRMC-F 0142]